MVGRPRPGRFMVYGEHHFRSAWIGWSWIALFSLGTIVGIAGQVMWRRPDSGYEPLAFFSGVFLVPALLITFNATRPVLVVGKRGVTVRELPGRGQLIPWCDIGEVTLVRNGSCRVVVNAYAGSVTTVCSIDRHRAERKFAGTVALSDQAYKYRHPRLGADMICTGLHALEGRSSGLVAAANPVGSVNATVPPQLLGERGDRLELGLEGGGDYRWVTLAVALTRGNAVRYWVR